MNRIIDSQYFFVLGFQKSGTSTLYEWLKQIDNIKLPLYKETHYFSDLNFYNKGLDWYFKQFNYNDKHTHLGEIDPSYILCEEYLKRIHEFSSKETKFIFILRQPLERAYSHYLMSKFRGYESLSFKEAIKLEPDRLKNDENGFVTTIKRNQIAVEKEDARPSRFSRGDKIDSMITEIDFEKRNVTLSIKALEEQMNKEAVKKYGSQDSGASLGDILGKVLKKRKPKSKE